MWRNEVQIRMFIDLLLIRLENGLFYKSSVKHLRWFLQLMVVRYSTFAVLSCYVAAVKYSRRPTDTHKETVTLNQTNFLTTARVIPAKCSLTESPLTSHHWRCHTNPLHTGVSPHTYIHSELSKYRCWRGKILCSRGQKQSSLYVLCLTGDHMSRHSEIHQ